MSMRTGENVRLRTDGRFEARYIKGRDPRGRAIYGYCYGKTLEEAVQKRELAMRKQLSIREMNLLILGAGSHGQEVRELAESLRIFQKIAFLDDAREGVLGPCRRFGHYVEEYPVAVAAVGDPALRMRWLRDLAAAGFVLPVLIHPTAAVSPSAEIGAGSVVCARATVGPSVRIGIGCIIASGATIERHAILPDGLYVDCGQVVAVARSAAEGST